MQLWMLFFFEGTVVFQRMQNFKRLKEMRVDARQLWVHRQGKWTQRMSDALYPGDVILLDRDTTP